MRDLQERLGLTYLLITHNLAVVRFMATRVGVMYLGRLVEIGETDALFSRPRHPYTRMLLDAVPDLSMSGRARTPIGGEPPNPIDPPPGCPFHPRCPQAIAICKSERPSSATTSPVTSLLRMMQDRRSDECGGRLHSPFVFKCASGK